MKTLKLVRKLPLFRALVPVMEVLAALGVGAILMLSAGVSPIDAYVRVAFGAFGNDSGIINTLVRTSPLLLTGLGIIVTFKCRVINLGAEGQLHIGAIAATWVGTAFAGLPSFLFLPLVIAIGFFAGGLLACLAGVLKVRFNVNEIISFLMLNYIILNFEDYLLTGFLQEPGFGFPVSRLLYPSAWLPTLFGTSLHIGLIIAILCALLVFLIFQKTTLGYKFKVIGSNQDLARYGGINVSRTIMIAMFISGGLAGLAGAFEISGLNHRLIRGFDPGYGWTGIAVARAASLQPFLAIGLSLFFAGLNVGIDSMARALSVPIFLSYVLYALVVISILLGEGVRIVLKDRRQKKRKEEKA